MENFPQTWCNLVAYIDLLRIHVVQADLLRFVIHKFDAIQVVSTAWSKSTNMKLHQILIFTTCINIDVFNRLAASCSNRFVKTCMFSIHKFVVSCCNSLQQVCKYQIAIRSLILTHLLQLDEAPQQTQYCNLLTTCSQPV